MAISFFQKLRLGLRGWSRRREAEARQRDADLLKRNVTWGPPPASAAPVTAAPVAVKPPHVTFDIDREGLQVAFLDDSGQLEHYLDTLNGEVIDVPAAAPRPEIIGKPERFRRVPARTAASDAADRAAFLATVVDAGTRTRLAVGDAAGFRRALSVNRSVERSWYNFKNDRATEAIERWLQETGLV